MIEKLEYSNFGKPNYLLIDKINEIIDKLNTGKTGEELLKELEKIEKLKKRPLVKR